jgi:hypothetical protein
MKNLIKAIGKYLNDIGSLEYLIDIENKKIADFDFEEIDRELYDGLSLITNHLQLIYLQGNDLVLNRVKIELLKIEDTLLKSNFGINILVVEHNFECSLEPEIHEALNKIKLKYVKELIGLIDSFLQTHETETKTDKLKAQLSKYGFFELPKVKRLSEPAKQSLLELIGKNDLPYSIAMLNFLDFLNHLEKEYFKTKYKLNIEVAKWFDSDKDGRRIKGNISVLSDYSNENKSKFTAHLHKETVKIDYQNLK